MNGGKKRKRGSRSAFTAVGVRWTALCATAARGYLESKAMTTKPNTPTQAPAATEAPPAAWLCTRPSGFAWPLMPKDMTPAVRETLEADHVVITPLHGATPAPSVGASLQEAFSLGRELESAMLEMSIAGDTPHDTDSPLSARVRRLTEKAQTLLVGASVQPVPVAYSEGRTLHWHAGRGITDAQLYAGPVQPVQASLSDERYRKLREWYLRDGTRAEIHPFGHVEVTTPEIFDAGVDALASSTPTKGGA